MPFNSVTKTFTRIWNFVDQFAAGEDADRADFDVAFDDIAEGVQAIYDEVETLTLANFRAFATRAEFLTWAADAAPEAGQTVGVGVVGALNLMLYVYTGSGTDLPEAALAGWKIGGQPTLQHFGAVGDGVTDDTDAVTAAGLYGGEVLCPKGRYLIGGQVTLDKTTFTGEGFQFDPMLVSSAADLNGTVFICNFETVTAESLFHLGQSGKIKDALLYYPNQTATRPASWTPTTTPWAVTSGSYANSSRLTRETSSGLDNVTFLEFTHGLRLNKGGERGTFHKVYGNCFAKFIEADANYDVTRFTDCHHWPFGGNTGAWQLEERRYTMNNCVAYGFGRVDGLILHRCFTIGSAVALDFFPSQSGDALNAGATTNFHVSDCYLDGCNISLRVSGTYASGWLPSGHITGGTMQHYSSADNEITTPQSSVVISTDIKEINLDSVRLTASNSARTGAFTRFSSGSGILSLNGCSTVTWDSNSLGEACFVGTAGTTLINNHRWFKSGNTPLTDFDGLTVSSGNVKFSPYHPAMPLADTGSKRSYTKYTSGEGPEFALRLAGGTLTTPAIPAAASIIGDYAFDCWDGTAFNPAAYLRAVLDGTVSAGVTPTKMQMLVENDAGNKVTALEATKDGVTMAGEATAPRYHSGSATIADDATHTIPTGDLIMGTLMLWVANGAAPASGYHGILYFDISSTPAIGKLSSAGGSLDTVTTDVTGTTGTDTNVTVSATDGALKIENRAGGSRDFRWVLLG